MPCLFSFIRWTQCSWKDFNYSGCFKNCVRIWLQLRLWFVDTVLWLCPSLPTETLKWLSALPILMQESFWWWQCSARYIITLFLHTPFPPFLISLMVSVDIKHHVYFGSSKHWQGGTACGFVLLPRLLWKCSWSGPWFSSVCVRILWSGSTARNMKNWMESVSVCERLCSEKAEVKQKKRERERWYIYHAAHYRFILVAQV